MVWYYREWLGCFWPGFHSLRMFLCPHLLVIIVVFTTLSCSLGARFRKRGSNLSALLTPSRSVWILVAWLRWERGGGVKFVCTINIIKEVRVRNGVYVKYVCTINTIKVDKDVPSSITRAELNVHFKLVWYDGIINCILKSLFICQFVNPSCFHHSYLIHMYMYPVSLPVCWPAFMISSSLDLGTSAPFSTKLYQGVKFKLI